jgi:RiboL-PSP-HEPN
MKTTYLKSRFSQIDLAIHKAKTSASGDVELEAFLASYLVVMISGCYEDCVEHLIAKRAAKAGDKEVEAFVRISVDKMFRNPKFEAIRDLVGLYSASYKQSLEKKVDDKARTAIGSIVTHKNSIAHGKNAIVTLGDVELYHHNSAPIFEALEDILG